LAKTATGPYVVWQQQNKIMAVSPRTQGPATIGEGAFPKVVALKDQKAFSVWEAEGQIVAKVLE
jgi:hypothetical protein